jgi:hypothetical protein
MDCNLNPTKGLRKRDHSLLAAERAARQFFGLPDGMSWPQAIGIIRAHIENRFSGMAAYRIMNHYLRMTIAKVRSIAVYDQFDHESLFVVFASNASLCARFDVSERCIQINHRRLVDAGLICFKDGPGCRRSPGNGISLLPAFARVRELQHAEFNAQMEVRAKRFLMAEFSACAVKLVSLIDTGLFPDTYSLQGLVEMAEQARIWSKGKLPAEPEAKMAAIKQTIEELEAFALVAYSSVSKDSPYPESGFAHITYKLKDLKIQVDAWREEESDGSEDSPDSSVLVVPRSDVDDVAIRLPSPEKAVKSIKKLMLARKLPLLEDDQLSDDQVLGLYGRRALGEIKLSKPAQTAIADRFGHKGLYLVALQAAHDPKIRHRAAWAAHFVNARPDNGVIDLQASFYRMVRDYCDHDSAAT